MTAHDLRRLLALILALLIAASACALAEDAAEGTGFGENAWNYVEGSMDVSHGIPADADGALASIRERGVLRVATEPYYAPQEFIDPNKTGQDSYVGADMELARLIAERMGVALQIIPTDFAGVLEAVEYGEADLAIAALSYTPGRAASVTLSKGYHFSGGDGGSGLIVREQNAEAIRSLADLEGRDIVAQSGSLQEMVLAENVFDYREFRRLSTVESVYQAVVMGKADAAAVDIDNARRYIRDNPDYGLTLVEDVRFTMDEQFQGDRVAAKKGEYRLMYFVNGVIDELLASGQYEAWYSEFEAYAKTL